MNYPAEQKKKKTFKNQAQCNGEKVLKKSSGAYAGSVKLIKTHKKKRKQRDIRGKKTN